MGGGVYRRNLIEVNHLYFPEHLAYEDNYWVYALQMYMENVSIVSQQLYYYRQQGESTVHKRNAEYHFDRFEISKRFLEFTKNRDLFYRYHKIIEYLFIEVFTYNTYLCFIKSFDKPPIERLEQVTALLKEEFPKWKTNELYKTMFSLKKKINMNLITNIPHKIYVGLHKLI